MTKRVSFLIGVKACNIGLRYPMLQAYAEHGVTFGHPFKIASLRQFKHRPFGCGP